MNSPRRLSAASAWRRLGVCLTVLVAADQAVLPLLRHAEARRYESDYLLRFENSDLFLLGPLIEYLREHPVGDRPRVAFLGDSIMWGYQIRDHEALPAMFQRLVPSARVFNFGVNGFQDASMYLVSKAVVEATDVFYVIHRKGDADPLLSQVMRIDSQDAARFGLDASASPEGAFARWHDPWRLRRYSYRLQGAWFGTSTRQHVYLHKGEWIRRLLGHGRGEEGQVPPLASLPRERAVWNAPVVHRIVSEDERRRLARRYPLTWDYAALLLRHRKHGVYIETSMERALADDGDRALMNAVFQPYVIFARVDVPDSWLLPDRTHFSPEGCRGMAELLVERTAVPFGLQQR